MSKKAREHLSPPSRHGPHSETSSPYQVGEHLQETAMKHIREKGW